MMRASRTGQDLAALCGLTIRSSRARFAVSDRPEPHRAGRLNSGVRRRQTQDLVVVSGSDTLTRNSRSSSATYSVQPESGCTPSAVVAPGEQRRWRTEPVLCSWPGSDRCLVKNSQRRARASLVGRLTIRSSRVRFAASAPAAMIQPSPWPLRCPA